MFAEQNSQTVGIIDHRCITYQGIECFPRSRPRVQKMLHLPHLPASPTYKHLLEAVKLEALPEWVRYLSAVFTVTLHWNHIFTIHDEVTYIWKRPFTEIKLLFIVCRYSAAASFIMIFFGLSSFSPFFLRDRRMNSRDLLPGFKYLSRCRNLVAVYSFLQLCICMIADYVLMIRLYSLWDYRKHVIYVLRGAFVLCWGVGMMCMVLTIRPIIRKLCKDVRGCLDPPFKPRPNRCREIR
ncbi:hypothetical protein BC834DRAFT_476354 [Gloeopeniophorella convolvens]|nr:hypothetical protein BC834DRAFT_476354 [Gloeopeniophorella convolvens]